jgi:hypothetical protein
MEKVGGKREMIEGGEDRTLKITTTARLALCVVCFENRPRSEEDPRRAKNKGVKIA